MPVASTLTNIISDGVPSTTSPVSLDGSFSPFPHTDIASKTRIFARSLRTWIFDSPKPNGTKIGAFRLGSSLAVAPEPVSKDGCPGGYYAVIPRGFVCRGDDSTLDGNDPLVRIGAEFPADISKKLPYIYGTVRKPGPIYRRLPNRGELLEAEPDIEKRMAGWLSAPGEIGANYGQQFWLDSPGEIPDPKQSWDAKRSDPIPWFLAQNKPLPLLIGKSKPKDSLIFSRMEPRVGYSILKTFLFEGRRYGLTSDFTIVPTDRLRPIQGSSFHGFRIPQDIDFPFAIVRAPKARLFEFDREKNQLFAKAKAAYRSSVKLTGKQNFFNNRLHYETSDGFWVSDKDVSRLDPVRKMPAWGKANEKWIDVNVTKQTLVLYEGTKAVYATLVSTGEAGLEEAENTTATRRGIFRIHTKLITATMSSDEAGEEFELRDVPYVQYFEEGYALHGAYWHDRFGIPKSHGCINLAPEDARRIFFWTEPVLPAGFRAVLKPLKGTVIFIHP
jgi:lipoprotein-anchoring transpeptidase ErfK/SrfK